MKMDFCMNLNVNTTNNKMNTCPAIKATGDVCGARCRGNPRCATHMKTLQNNGPHTTARKELSYRHRASVNLFREEMDQQLNLQPNQLIRERLLEDLEHQLHLMRIEHTRQMNLLIREQEDEIRQTGIDPDRVANERREAMNRQRNENNRLRWEQRIADARNQQQDLVAMRGAARAIEILNQAAEARAVPRGELANFANDNQNVHTSVAVQQTKEMVQKLLNIPVPDEYRWNMVECSKTPGDIIMCCKLTPKGGWQMIAKYCQDENIYEMGQGIYGKVLDCVWQYVLKSADKEDLCKILKQEMEDNIGMCAQGNLTRLCNILSGYMEGIGPQESPAEVLGRKLPLLMEIDNIEERMNEAYKLLVELAIPEEQWMSWVEPLVDEGTISFKSNGAGQVIGLYVV